jgi:hypothetical protein
MLKGYSLLDEDEVDLAGSESNGILTPLEQIWSISEL